ncbi:hypothetical protein C1646_732223 [Rhizophagus diaphanus]|nr:hypothetical protein C1646_732223 [Rhizophagus diaphanus] [Rhizophagus sp. MUCL 43196]
MLGTLRRLPMTNRRKVGMTSNHHAPYDLGYTRATMDGTNGCELESLVIADQHAAVNTFPGLVHTARHTTRVCNTRSR